MFCQIFARLIPARTRHQLFSPTTAMSVVVGALSILSPVLPGLQTFLRINERAAKHQALAEQSHAICTKIELLLANPPNSQDLSAIMIQLKDQVADLSKA